MAGGEYLNPVPFADFVTTTTHKTLRAWRGGVILGSRRTRKILNSAIFPCLQGGPLMHVIAAKAVAFKEAASDDFKAYAKQVKVNASAMAEELIKRGLRIVSGRTESHVPAGPARQSKSPARTPKPPWAAPTSPSTRTPFRTT